MSTTTAMSTSSRLRRQPWVADPDRSSTPSGSVMVDRRSERPRRASDVLVARRGGARPSWPGWPRARAVIGGVAAAVFLGTLSS
jgi:hypothetical protein